MNICYVLATAGLGLTLAACQNAPAANSKSGEVAEESNYEPKTVSQAAYEEANMKMHAGMAAVHPDPDIAFMQGMVPHHQGAVDMAEIVLKYGTDPETLALAKTIIESQTKEIAQMNAWLEKRGVEPAKPSDVDHEAMGH